MFMFKRLIFLVALLTLFMYGCGDDGGSTTYYDPTPPENQGTKNDPIVLSIGTAHASSIGGWGNKYYKFTTGAIAKSYIIALAVTQNTLHLDLYSDAGFSNWLDGCGNSGPGTDASCNVSNLDAGTTYYLETTNYDGSAGTYYIAVQSGSSEGSVATPADITVGTPHSGAIDASGYSYYWFTTGATAGSYIIGLTNTQSDLGWSIYSGSGFTGLLHSCNLSSVAADEICTTNLDPNTSYYIKVHDYDGVQGTYTLTVTSGTSDGSPNNPLTLTVGTPHSGSIDASGYGYYRFTTGAVAGTYIISLTNTQSDLSWRLYTGPGFTGLLQTCDTNSAAADETCTTTNLDANTTYYIGTNEIAGVQGTYTLTVTKGTSEGSKNDPVALTVGTPHSGSIEDSRNSYYTFTTGATAMPYTITLTNLQANLGWTLYSDPAFSISVDSCNANWSTADETCTTPVSLTAGTPYYIRVNEYDVISSPYDITVIAGGGSEGSVPSPVEVFVGPPHAGSIYSYGNSYYKFTTGAAGDYVIELTNPTLVALYVYDMPDFTNQIKSCPSAVNQTCVITGLAATTPYYVRAYEYDGNDVLYDLTVDYLDPLGGCGADAAECFDFEDGLFPLSFISSGDAGWLIDTANAAAGSNSLSSGVLSDSQRSCFSYTPAYDTRSVGFTLMTDSELTWDKLEFRVDGTLKGTWSGPTPWKRLVYGAASGIHIYSWCYIKNSGGFSGADTVWVDDIELK